MVAPTVFRGAGCRAQGRARRCRRERRGPRDGGEADGGNGVGSRERVGAAAGGRTGERVVALQAGAQGVASQPRLGDGRRHRPHKMQLFPVTDDLVIFP